MNDKHDVYIVAVVAIVAVIGIVVMLMGNSDKMVYGSPAVYDSAVSGTDSFGQAITVKVDLTPRIAYWSGKINQHVNIATGIWETDPDGKSGASINTLTYCKKWYPKTTSVAAYKMETITTWKNGGNTGGPFTSTKQSYKCIQSTPVCGDGSCSGVESCSNCRTDCGTCVVNVSPCIDTDGGLNYYLKGEATMWDQSINSTWAYGDSCLSDATLQEAYCDSAIGRPNIYNYDCPYGCRYSACINATLMCKDTDGGQDYTNAGIISYGGIDYPDYCREKNPSSPNNIADAVPSCSGSNCYLVENYCTNANEGNWISTNCSYGCMNGACVQATCPQYISPSPDWCANGTIVDGGRDSNGCVNAPTCKINPTCTDTDSGIDIYTKGWINSSSGVAVDTCESLSKRAVPSCTGTLCGLKEYYCTDANNDGVLDTTKFVDLPSICPNGCIDGACY